MIGRLIVTGASGFIGRAVVDAARRQSMAIRAVSRRPMLLPGVEAVSVRDYADTPVDRDDGIIHLAETRNASGEPPVMPGAIDVVQALLAHQPRTFVYVSSAVVYGDGEATPRRPADRPAIAGFYAETKRAAESVVEASGGINARLSNVYGPGMSERSVIAQILAQIPGHGPLTIRSGSPVRDFLWVADAAEGLLALTRTATAGTYNLGTGIGTSISELARMALTIAGEGDRPIIEEAPQVTPSHLVLDISETQHTTGWSPRTTLAEGLSFCLSGSR